MGEGAMVAAVMDKEEEMEDDMAVAAVMEEELQETLVTLHGSILYICELFFVYKLLC